MSVLLEYREPYKGADEDEIRLEFQSQVIQLVLGCTPAAKWEWYFLMSTMAFPRGFWTGLKIHWLRFSSMSKRSQGLATSAIPRPVGLRCEKATNPKDFIPLI